VAGEGEQQDQSFASLNVGIALALLLVFMVMAAQFESLSQPVLVMTSVPFAGIGVVAVLVLTGTTLNLNSFMGIIVLVGIVVNNAIVLLDAANQLRMSGMPVLDAAVEASRRRLRPILMTTSTTMLGLLPIALGIGTGAEAQAPLARVIVGGLASSTLVTLVVIPVLYAVVIGISERRSANRVPSV
jgi:HAE1 family hydrophobic/amphiphilic exporter-1